MSWGIVASAAASIGGSMLTSGATSDAADMQAKSTADSNALQKYMYDNNVKLQQPAMDAGNTARNRLMQLLGLGGTAGGSAGMTYDAARQQLLPQYSKSGGAGDWYQNYDTDGGAAYWMKADGTRGDTVQNGNDPNGPGGAGGSSVDEAGLDAAIKQLMASNGAQPDSNSADYGSLMKNFTGADLASEPGYAFGLSEGNKALDRRAASGGNYFSGAALKGATRYAQDYAGTKYGEAYNRDAANKDRSVNYLNGVITPGAAATTQIANSGTQYATAAGNNLMNNANAQGAAGIAGANTIGAGLSSAANSYNQSQLMDKILGGSSGLNSLRNGLYM